MKNIELFWVGKCFADRRQVKIDVIIIVKGNFFYKSEEILKDCCCDKSIFDAIIEYVQ